ncbi:MAG: ABC transporter ATP-binding protein, partial [bacterium]|nr:ABC transporter ATP-binding protein [bacterium]
MTPKTASPGRRDDEFDRSWSTIDGQDAERCGIVGPMIEAPEFHEEEALGKVYDARLMRRLLGYIRPYWGMATGAVALIIVSSLLQLVGPLVMGVTRDVFIKPFADSLPPVCQRFEAPLCRMVDEDRSDLPPFCQRFEAPLCRMVAEDKGPQ